MKRKLAAVLCMAMVLNLFPAMPADAGQIQEQDDREQVTQFMDCMDPMPVVESLSDTCWGAAEVGARDQGNGLEDRELKNYCYWDGSILKENGKYYMFASRWNQAGGHWGENGISGWQGSQAIYAVSDSLYGPYEDQGPIWPDWCEGAGHNVFAFRLSEKDALYGQGYRFAISISDTGMHGDVANGTIHIAKSLDGPWDLIENGNNGKLKAEGDFGLSNISIMVRPDGRYEATNRNGDIALADSVAGTWEVKENGLWWKTEGMNSSNVEDPVIWYSDGLYHIVANKWDARLAYYLTSEDGITGWKRHPGTAYTPGAGFLRYENGTVNDWTKLERPNIYVEDGKIAAMTFAVIDVQKEQDFGNDQHGSKVIVVPFSSEKLQQLDAQPDPLDNREGIVASEDMSIQTWEGESSKNYGAETHLHIQKSPDIEKLGMGFFGEGVKKESGYDNKIAFVKFPLTEELLPENREVDHIYLSMVYKDKMAGSAEKTRVQVVLADSDWIEGSGNEAANENRADPGTATAENQPSLDYDLQNLEKTSALSEEFNTADLNKELKIDVTELVRQFREKHPGKKTICFAMNSTVADSRMQLYSREAGERKAPRLAVQLKPCRHVWDAGVVTAWPTAKKEGNKAFTCTICKEVRNESIPSPKAGNTISNASVEGTYKVTSVKTANGKTTGTVAYKKPAASAKTVTIPAKITAQGVTYTVASVDASAFKNNQKLTKVTIGNNVKTIGSSAFSGCKNLKTVTMGKNVTSLGAKSFYQCTALTKITIPSKAANIGKQCFSGCKKLKNITIQTKKLTAKKIGSNAFQNISGKAVIKVPKSKWKTYQSVLKKRGIGKKVKIKK